MAAAEKTARRAVEKLKASERRAEAIEAEALALRKCLIRCLPADPSLEAQPSAELCRLLEARVGDLASGGVDAAVARAARADWIRNPCLYRPIVV